MLGNAWRKDSMIISSAIQKKVTSAFTELLRLAVSKQGNRPMIILLEEPGIVCCTQDGSVVA